MMKIIAGSFKNRYFKMPKGIRPTQDKVRKALFDILSPQIKESIFLDLFSGSGSVGLEALSRGAEEVTLVENNRDCLNLLKENLNRLKPQEWEDKILTLAMDSFAAIDFLFKHSRKFNIVFLDPPYYKDAANKILKKLISCDILSANGIAVVQHHKKDLLPKKAGFLRLLRQESYGDNLLSFYEKG